MDGGVKSATKETESSKILSNFDHEVEDLIKLVDRLSNNVHRIVPFRSEREPEAEKQTAKEEFFVSKINNRIIELKHLNSRLAAIINDLENF